MPWEDITGLTLTPTPRFNNRFTRSAVAVAIMRRHEQPIYCLGASFAEPSSAADSMLGELQSQHHAWLDRHPAP